MSGADRDIDGRFRSIEEIRNVLSGETERTTDASSLLAKGPNDEDWRPLLLGVTGAS